MQLKAYLAQENLRPTHFAKILGLRPSTVTRWLNVGRIPSLESMRLVEKATQGAVTADDFLSSSDDEPAPAVGPPPDK